MWVSLRPVRKMFEYFEDRDDRLIYHSAARHNSDLAPQVNLDLNFCWIVVCSFVGSLVCGEAVRMCEIEKFYSQPFWRSEPPSPPQKVRRNRPGEAFMKKSCASALQFCRRRESIIRTMVSMMDVNNGFAMIDRIEGLLLRPRKWAVCHKVLR